MIHISELSDGYVKQVSDVLNEGDEVVARVIPSRDPKRIGLSLRRSEEEKKENPGFEKMMERFLKQSAERQSRSRTGRRRG